MTLKLKLMIAAAVAAVAAAGWWTWSTTGGRASAKPATPPPVLAFLPTEVGRLERATLEEVLEVSGSLVAPSTAIVRAKSSATLVQFQVEEGARVRAGQVLGALDLSDLASRVAERSALLDSARAALSQAERAHQQNQSLAAQRFISSAALDTSLAAVETARAQLAAAEASLNVTRVSLREASLVAPIAGIVSKRHVVQGEKLAPEQPLVTLVDLVRLELAGTVGTHQVARLPVGMEVPVTVEGLDRSFPGRIARIAAAAEAGTRSIGVTVAVANPQEQLRAGQFATARVVLRDPTPRWILPVAAVYDALGQAQVWTLAGGTLQRKTVVLGRRDPTGARVEIVEGLGPDTPVLLARYDNLKDGAAARIASASPASGPTAAAAASVPASGR